MTPAIPSATSESDAGSGTPVGSGSLKWMLSMKKSHVIPVAVLWPVVAPMVMTFPVAAKPIVVTPLDRFGISRKLALLPMLSAT